MDLEALTLQHEFDVDNFEIIFKQKQLIRAKFVNMKDKLTTYRQSMAKPHNQFFD